MHTHEWNNAVRNELLSLPAAQCAPFAAGNRSLRILVSLAAGDGVYDLEDLRHDLDDDCMPAQVRLVAQHLLDRTGVYDLRDLQAALADAAADQDNSPFCHEGCGCDACLDAAAAAGVDVDDEPDYETERVHLRRTMRPAAKLGTDHYAVVSIDHIRIYLPDDVDADDEDAVKRYIRRNLNRVREAALECDRTQVTVTDVRTASPAVPA